MAKCNSARYFFSLTSLQIGDLQSYLSQLSLFLAPDSNTFYVLVDNRPWLQDLVSRPAHLWQLMVTKSRMSPFAIRRSRKGRNDSQSYDELEYCSETPTPSENLRKWFLVIDAATLSKKRALLPVKKLRSSLLKNSKLHRTLYGFIVFEVAWKDVRGINYLNELQTDTSLAIEAKYMKRWEFDSIDQAAKGITSWFPGTPRECFILKEQLNSMLGGIFHDTSNNTSTTFDEQTETSKGHISPQDSTPQNSPNKRRKTNNYINTQLDINLNNELNEPTQSILYKDVLLLLKFNDPNLPFELQKIITSDLRLLTLLEAGLPSWVTFFQSYPVFCHIYRPWMCPLARVLYVIISLVTVVIGFYDLYKNIPVLKATAERLCGPLFGWIETWEMVSRIKYLGTMLFLHNFEKAVKWFLMVSCTVQAYVAVVMEPLVEPFMVVWEVVFPVWSGFVKIGEWYCSFVWILIATLWSIIENLMEIVLFPICFILSFVWMIAMAILYPVFWFIFGILYAPIRLVIGLSNFVGFIFNQMYDFIGDTWLFVSGVFKLASNAESSSVTSYEVSMWRALWNDLFSQIFRAVRSILNGFVAFFTACNRHRLSIYNHLQEFIRRLYQPSQRSRLFNSIQRAKKSGSRTLAEARERRNVLLTKNIKQS